MQKSICTRCQFHQHFMSGFFVQELGEKLFCAFFLGLNLFWHKNIGANVLVKLIKGGKRARRYRICVLLNETVCMCESGIDRECKLSACAF